MIVVKAIGAIIIGYAYVLTYDVEALFTLEAPIHT